MILTTEHERFARARRFGLKAVAVAESRMSTLLYAVWVAVVAEEMQRSVPGRSRLGVPRKDRV